MIGPLLNCATVVVGSIAGALVGRFIPEPVRAALPNVFGLVALALGISLVARATSFTSVVLALILGTLIGELLDLQGLVQRGAAKFQAWLTRRRRGDSPAGIPDRFAEVFSSLLILFCTGPMALIGGIQEGLAGDASLLIVKSILDLFTSAVFATAVGAGVAILCLPVLLIEGAYVLAAQFLSTFMGEAVIAEISACAGIILVGTGIRLLEIKSIRTVNMIPALPLIPFLSMLIAIWWG